MNLSKNNIIPTLAALLIASTASAQIVSINFADNDNGNLIDPADAVGELVDGGAAADNWNNFRVLSSAFSGTAQTVVDSTGATASTTFALNSISSTPDGTRRTFGLNVTNQTAITNLVRNGYRFDPQDGRSDGGENVLTLTDTASIFGSGSAFDLYIYGASNGKTANISANVNGSLDVQSLLSTNGEQLDATMTEGVDYVLLRNISAVAGDIGIDIDWLSQSVQKASGIGGIQMVAVPEPSTYAMIAGALALGIVMLRRRS